MLEKNTGKIFSNLTFSRGPRHTCHAEFISDRVLRIVGHSNTLPALLNIMTGANTFPDLGETGYDNLFIAHASAKGDATVIQMKYGEQLIPDS